MLFISRAELDLIIVDLLIMLRKFEFHCLTIFYLLSLYSNIFQNIKIFQPILLLFDKLLFHKIYNVPTRIKKENKLDFINC